MNFQKKSLQGSQTSLIYLVLNESYILLLRLEDFQRVSVKLGIVLTSPEESSRNLGVLKKSGKILRISSQLGSEEC